MTQFSALAVIILIPGIIAALIFDKLTRHEPRNYYTFSVHAVLFGWFSYLPLYCITPFRSSFQAIKLPLKDFGKIDSNLYEEVIWACGAGIIMAFIFAFIVNHNYLNRFARLINCSHKYGDESLFSHYLQDEQRITHICVHSLEKQQSYHGRLEYYCDDEGFQELLLKDADIYPYQGSARLNHADELYLCGKKGDFTIELKAGGQSEHPAKMQKRRLKRSS